MVRLQEFDFEPFREEIKGLLQEGCTQRQILLYLNQEHDMKPSKPTLKKQLHRWGLTSRRYQYRPDPVSGILILKIEELVHRHKYNNQQIVDALAKMGIMSSVYQVEKIRLDKGWTLRNRSTEAQDSNWQTTKDLCWEAVMRGPARNWGRGHLQTYLQVHYSHLANVSHVQAALKDINAHRGVDHRPIVKPGRRPEALFHGPNYVWSIDGHAKLSPYGIDIYGAVDGYSRKLIWLYVGVSNQTQVSTAKQFLQTLDTYKIRPRYIRADRGVEIDMLLDVQYNLFRAHELQAGRCSPDEVNTLRSTSCILLGKSTANQRIESIWKRMLVAQIQPWRELFRQLTRRRRPLFLSDYPSDMVVLLYVFMPLIRQEILAWQGVHNHRRIRKDNTRPNHVAGKPNDLWGGLNLKGERPRDYGTVPDQALLQDRLDKLSDYGMALSYHRAIYLFTNYIKISMPSFHPRPWPGASRR